MLLDARGCVTCENPAPCNCSPSQTCVQTSQSALVLFVARRAFTYRLSEIVKFARSTPALPSQLLPHTASATARWREASLVPLFSLVLSLLSFGTSMSAPVVATPPKLNQR